MRNYLNSAKPNSERGRARAMSGAAAIGGVRRSSSFCTNGGKPPVIGAKVGRMSGGASSVASGLPPRTTVSSGGSVSGGRVRRHSLDGKKAGPGTAAPSATVSRRKDSFNSMAAARVRDRNNTLPEAPGPKKPVSAGRRRGSQPK